VGGKLENGAFFGSGQTWTLPDARAITLDVYPPYQRYRRVYPPNRWRADRAVYPYGGEGTLAILATDLEFEGSRVKSPILGRDFNPMGRGDGVYYANGGNYADSANVVISGAKPVFTGEAATGFGSGVNNTYSPEECQKLRNEQLRRLEEDPACKKEIGLDPNVCCITECGVGLPDGKEKDRRRRSCDCCCCLAKGCPPCLYPLPPECILCCVGGITGEGGKACDCTDTSQGDPCASHPCDYAPNTPCDLKANWLCDWLYYRRKDAVKYQMPSCRTLCKTCGYMFGSGETPCPKWRLSNCQLQCQKYNRILQVFVWALCMECCRVQHNYCVREVAVDCACVYTDGGGRKRKCSYQEKQM